MEKKIEIKSKLIGEHKEFLVCRFCLSKNLEQIINLGNIPLAGGFLKKGIKKSEFLKEKFYPLHISFCKDCYFLQVSSSVNPDILFKNYFYFSSSIKTLVRHFEKNVEELKIFLSKPKNKLIVEIGCNDGSFIAALQQNNFTAVGVDPAINVVKPLQRKGMPIINDYFTEKVADSIIKKYGKADAIYSFHSMAHIEDIREVYRGVKKLLKDDGFAAVEVHYLGNLITEMQFDMIYHEHQYYYSLIALQKFLKQFNMEVFDVKRIPVRGGSIQFFIQNKESKKRRLITSAVKKLAVEEREEGFDTVKRFKDYAKQIEKVKEKLISTLDELKKEGKTIAGYGASGRGTIVINYCGLDKEYLDYVVDDAPAKHGAFIPGTHQKILSSNILQSKNKPDYVLLFAWPFFEEIKKKQIDYSKNGGKFIVPLPKVKIV